MDYRRDLQGLRAVAVLFVFMYHINSAWMPGGYIGVDIFFVLSGFLVSQIVLNQIEKGTFSFGDFYLRRIKRIVPAYYLMLSLTAIATFYVLLSTDINEFKRELLHALAFDSDRVYAGMHSYFGVPVRQHPLLHTWTIANEMKFYLFLPMVLYFTPRKYLIHTIITLSLIFLIFGVYEVEILHNKSWAYYSLPVRIPEFGIGILIALKGGAIAKYLMRFKNAISIAGIITLVMFAFLVGNKHFKGLVMLVPCFAAAVLLLWNDTVVNRFLSRKVFERIGTLSYSIYLWHWPVIALTRYYNAGSPFSLAQYIFIIFTTIVLSWLSFVFIEDILRKQNNKAFVYSIIPLCIVPFFLYVFASQINSRFFTIPVEYTTNVNNVGTLEKLGNVEKEPDILLIGNSHALCLKPYISYLGKKHHFSCNAVTTNTYPPINGLNENEVINRGRYYDYEEAKKATPLVLKEIQKRKVIVMAMSSWVMIPSLITAIETIADNLAPGQQLLLVTPFPTVSKNPLQINRGIVKDKSREQDYKIYYRKENQDLSWLEKKHKNIHFLDLSKNDVFKDAPFLNDTIMYYDKSHINQFGAEALAKSTENEFMELLTKYLNN